MYLSPASEYGYFLSLLTVNYKVEIFFSKTR